MAELKKLRECPFCGGEAKLQREHDIFTDSYEAYFECKDCGARTKSVDVTGYSRDGSAVFNPLILLESLWNNRATESEIRNKAINDFFNELQKYEKDDWLKLKMLSIYHIAEQLKEE